MRVVSLFCGAGGLDLGFQQAGHEIVWSNDIYSDAVETYRRNLGDHAVCGDITKIKSSDIPDCDIVIGGFPCQGFSVANMKRHTDDERNILYRELLRVISDKRPAFFLAENVKGLLNFDKGRAFKRILNDFTAAGYRVAHQLFNAADFGVPQRRERVIICYIGHRPLNPDLPAPTVTARGDDRGGVVILPHPNSARRMTGRELATVQGFPLDFEFAGRLSSVYRQIGNAVPPPLAKSVASKFPRRYKNLRWRCDNYRGF